MRKLLTLVMVLSVSSLFAQNNYEHVMSLDDSAMSPKASVEDVAWIAGHWRGEAFGGIVEEIWSPPMGGSMMCAFRLIVEDKVQFYEIESIIEENESLVLKIKHFNADLTGWEEKNETVDFRLVKLVDNIAYFDGFTFEKISDDELNMYVLVDQGEEVEEVLFNYKRYK